MGCLTSLIAFFGFLLLAPAMCLPSQEARAVYVIVVLLIAAAIIVRIILAILRRKSRR